MELIISVIKLFFSVLEGVFELLFKMFFHQLMPREKKLTAKFVPQGTVLSCYNKGFCLTGRKSLTVRASYKNALVIGGTGTGKSAITTISSIFVAGISRHSLIIHDPSGELRHKTSGRLHSIGYEVRVLNFTKPEASCGFNPLARAQSSSDIQKISSMLVQSTLGGKTSDPFWNTQAVGLLAMLITLLKTQDSQYQNLYNARHLLNNMGGNPEAVDSLFSKYANDILFGEYKAFLSYDAKVVSGIVATCKAALQIFSDESVAKVTSFDNLNLMDFRDKPVALFIQNSVADQRYYSTLTSILFEQFFSFILSRFPDKQEKDIFFLIDEASSLSLPTLPLAVANIRKHRGGIMLLLQDFNQLVHNYGRFEAESIRSNCFAKMYFTGQSLETAHELEQILGRLEYEDDKGNRVIRSLMTNDEIRTMDTNRALLVCGHHPPIIARLKPYYKRTSFKSYSSIPTPEFNSSVEAEIPLLPLN